MKRLTKLSLFTVFLIAGTAQAAVWENRNEWSPRMESRYRDWVRSNWSPSFFVNGPSTYRGLQVDCADAVYSMRAIFAAENNLPFVMRDPSSSSRTISNSMSRFDSLGSESARKRAFIAYLFGVVSTRSLPNDTYPAALSRDTIAAGTIALSDAANHHSWTLNDVSPQGVPSLVFGSRPARSMMFYRKYIPTTGFMFPNGNTLESNAGFRNFRRTEDLLRPVFQAQGFSDEQYRIPLRNFHKEFQRRVSSRAESGAERLVRVMEDACAGAKERVVFVSDGLKYRDRIGGRCMNATEFDDHSTPGRDERLKDNFLEIVEAYRAAGGRGASRDILASAEAVVNGSRDTSGYCMVNVGNGVSLSLATIAQRMLNGDLSSNPNDGHEYRWGQTRGGIGPRGRSCPSY